MSDAEDADSEDSNSRENSNEKPSAAPTRGRARSTRGRGHGRGQAARPQRRQRGRGRAQIRGQGRRGLSEVGATNTEAAAVHQGYDYQDTKNALPPFSPSRTTGFHPNNMVFRGNMNKALDFFRLFFTIELIQEICQHTNAYGWFHVEKKPYYGDKRGAWIETNPEEIDRLIALILYMGIVRVSSFHRYWSTKTLYHGLWARSIMARDRFKALMAMLHVVDFADENPNDKLRKVVGFANSIREKCKALYQPSKHMAVDERNVKSKHRSGIRQYVKNKPTKFGIKLWVLADSANGYTYDFEIYAGKTGAQQAISNNGLGYDIVTRLVHPLLNQGYHLFFDNFYMSLNLVKHLFHLKTPSCGTTAENRKRISTAVERWQEMGPQTGKGEH